MTTDELMNAIEVQARLRGEPMELALRHHLLTSVVHRVARSVERESFVLRGGLLTRAWVAPELHRPTRDLDFVGAFTFNLEEVIRRFEEVISDPDLSCGVRIHSRVDSRGIWLDSEFPGVRFTLRLGIEDVLEQPITIDVGFNDPLIPAPVWTRIDDVEVRCVRPETQVSWKLHALAEMGESFRPKDLADLWRIIKKVKLLDDDLPSAIHAAFVSRGYTIEQARDVLTQPHWETKTARVRWSPDRTGGGLPPLPTVLKDIRARLDAPLARLQVMNRK